MELIDSGCFDLGESGVFEPIASAIRNPYDPWMTAADFRSYIEAQQCVNEAYTDRQRWSKMAVLNTAHSGRFSSDRTIREYRDQIWYR